MKITEVQKTEIFLQSDLSKNQARISNFTLQAETIIFIALFISV